MANLQSGASFFARRIEAKLVRELGERHEVGLFRNANRALSLNVGMAAHGRHAGPLTTDIAAQQEEIDQHADALRSMDMLGQAHAINADDALGRDIDIGGRRQFGAEQAGNVFDLVPVGGARRGDKGLDPLRVLD